MTIKQKILKAMYPVLLKITRLAGKNTRVIQNEKGQQPPEPIHNLAFQKGSGEQISLSQLKGRKLLFVNTASNCGYTAQYSELQQLHKQAGEKLAIIGFPANDFKEQEGGSDEDIRAFCSLNFGVEFPLAKKSVVVKGEAQNEVYQWLTNARKNGWNNQAPSWNFAKYLVDEEGVLTHYFDPSVSPLQAAVLQAIQTKISP